MQTKTTCGELDLAMHRIILACLVGLCMPQAVNCAPAAETLLDVLGRLPSLEDAAISPDASRIAYVKTTGDDRYVHVVSLADHKSLKVLAVGETKLRQILWPDNDNLLFVISKTEKPSILVGAKTEFFSLGSYNVTNNKLENPLSNVVPEPDVWVHALEFTTNTIVGVPVVRQNAGRTVVFVPGLATDVNRHFKPVLIRFTPGAITARIIVRGQEWDSHWLLDRNGEIVAEDVYDEAKQNWILSARLDGHLKPVETVGARIDHPQLVGISPDGGSIWTQIFSGDGSDPVLKAVSLKDGSMSGPLAESTRFGTFLLEPRGPRIIAGARGANLENLEFFDSHMRETWNFVVHSFHDEHVSFVSASDNFDHLIIRVEGADDGYVLLLFDTATYEFKSIGNIYDGLTTVAVPKSLSYRSADGMDIPAFITLPLGREAKNLPLIVLVHGGPAEHDTGHFDWLAQALASQGYAVLQPNYRGSNLNWQLMSAGFGEWGRKMQTDLSDGVRQLAKDGLIDAKRVCVVGASYGGYAALAGASMDTGVYRCAVSIAGISNLKMFQDVITQAESGRADSRIGRYWDRYIGASGPNDSILKDRSPIQHVDSIEVPVLVIHGRDDSVVPYDQSERMVDAMRRAHKQVEFVTLQKEDHWLSRSETRLQTLREVVGFLRANNPPD